MALVATPHDNTIYRLTVGGDTTLEIPDYFFARHFTTAFHARYEFPEVRWWTVEESRLLAGDDASSLPILYGSGRVELGKEARIDADFVGAIYCELSRFEEYFVGHRDEHNRFPADRARAVKCGYLDIAVVDEYAEIVRRILGVAASGEGEVHVSCDVDHPFLQSAFSLPWKLRSNLRALLPGVFAPHSAAKRLNPRSRANRVPGFSDPWASAVAYQAAQLTARGMRGTFHFIPVVSDSRREGPFSLEDGRVGKMARYLADAGHEIALHPGYRTIEDVAAMEDAIAVFDERIHGVRERESPLVSRNHYLRWSTPDTIRVLQRSGVDEDRSLAYAQRAGFRASTCKPFALFDVQSGQALKVVERPLVVMESSLLDPRYEGLDHDSARGRIVKLHAATQRVRGTFSMLWHNSHLDDDVDCDLFEFVLGLHRGSGA